MPILKLQATTTGMCRLRHAYKIKSHRMTMRHFFTSALLALSAATLSAAPAPSVLDIKHSLRDDNVRPPESFETQSRA